MVALVQIFVDFIRPVFSPDGETLAYADKGMNLYSVSTGVSNLVIEDQYGDPLPEGPESPHRNIYRLKDIPPMEQNCCLHSAIGKLRRHTQFIILLQIHWCDTEEVTDYIYCCSFHGGPAWSADSSSFYGVASLHERLLIR